MNDDYDHSIHTNPSAVAWARFFMETKAKNPTIADDEECMVGWFANAMMAMYDSLGDKSRQNWHLSSDRERLAFLIDKSGYVDDIIICAKKDGAITLSQIVDWAFKSPVRVKKLKEMGIL